MSLDDFAHHRADGKADMRNRPSMLMPPIAACSSGNIWRISRSGQNTIPPQRCRRDTCALLRIQTAPSIQRRTHRSMQMERRLASNSATVAVMAQGRRCTQGSLPLISPHGNGSLTLPVPRKYYWYSRTVVVLIKQGIPCFLRERHILCDTNALCPECLL